MAVLSINKNGIISLENYNDYSQEGFKEVAAKTGFVFLKIVFLPLSIVGYVLLAIIKVVQFIINLFRKIIQKVKLFSYKLSPETNNLMLKFVENISISKYDNAEDEKFEDLRTEDKVYKFFKENNIYEITYNEEFEKLLEEIRRSYYNLSDRVYKNPLWYEIKNDSKGILYKELEKVNEEINKLKTEGANETDKKLNIDKCIKITNEVVNKLKKYEKVNEFLVQFKGDFKKYYTDVEYEYKELNKVYIDISKLNTMFKNADNEEVIPKSLNEVLTKFKDSLNVIGKYNGYMLDFVVDTNSLFVYVDKTLKSKKEKK